MKEGSIKYWEQATDVTVKMLQRREVLRKIMRNLSEGQ